MQKLRVLQISLASIATVLFIEGAISFAANSLAILNDAMHALFDSVTMVILILMARMGLRLRCKSMVLDYG